MKSSWVGLRSTLLSTLEVTLICGPPGGPPFRVGGCAIHRPREAVVDADRKRTLRRLGKAEVERRSAGLRAELAEANPALSGSDDWGHNYKVGTERERWLRRKSPTLRKEMADALFVVRPIDDPAWIPHRGAYVRCTSCGSVAPAVVPRRLFYWRSCECKNIRLRGIGPWRWAATKNSGLLVPVKLLGRGDIGRTVGA